MGWFSTAAEVSMQKGSGLTADERRRFDRLDEKVALGAKAAKVVIEAGRALAEIRDRQLFRAVSESWETYLGRHGLNRRRADQMVAAATTWDAVVEVVQSKIGTAVPELSERAIRPLVGMAPEAAAEAVIEAAGTADGITPATVRRAASRRKPKVRLARPRRFKVAGAVVTVTWNRKGNGSAIDALAAALRQAEADLENQSEAA